MKEKLKIVLLTIDKAGEILLSRLVCTLPSEIEISMVLTREDRSYDFDGNPVVNACKKYSIPYLQPNFNKDDYLQVIADLNPSVIIISNFHRIIKKELIDIPSFGTYNLHSSLLPELRGGTSIIWALNHGLEQTGATLHEVTEGVDDGDIISQKPISIDFWDTQGTLYEKITLVKYELLLNFLLDLKNGNIINRIPQDHSKATHLPKRKDSDGVLNMEADFKSIYNHLRSFDPWTGAYFDFGETPIRLRNVVPVNYYMESKLIDNALIISRNSEDSIKSLVINSVTSVVEHPRSFERKQAREVLEFWNKMCKV